MSFRKSILFNSKTGILVIASDREKEKYLSEGFQHIQYIDLDGKVSYEIFFCEFHKRYEFVFYEYIYRKPAQEELILKIIGMIGDCRYLGLDPNDSPIGLRLILDDLTYSYIQLNQTTQKKVLAFIKRLIELKEKTIIYFFLNSSKIYTDVLHFLNKNNIETIKSLTSDDLRFLKDEIRMILYLNVVGLRKEIDKIKRRKLVRIHHILLYFLNIKRTLEETNDNDVLQSLKQLEELIRDNCNLLIKYFRFYAKGYFFEDVRKLFLKDMFITLYRLSGDARFLRPLI
jgi:hypothetical protein